MTGKRTRSSAEFKAKVALEALRGELTAVQSAAKHGIHHTMAGEWKRQAVGLAVVFSGQATAQETAKSTEARWRNCPPRSGIAGGAGFFGQGVRTMSLERRRQMIAWSPAAVGDAAV